MNKRLNITLPEQTVRLLDKVTDKGDRSSFIDRAVRQYLKKESRDDLRKRLIEGYKANAELDLKIAKEWSAIEEEAWQHIDD